MSYHDELDSMPRHLQRAWYKYRQERLGEDRLWAVLDRASEVLSKTNCDLSAELELAAEDVAGVRNEEVWDDFCADHEGWDEDEETRNQTTNNAKA
jgi:hypothetical protein